MRLKLPKKVSYLKTLKNSKYIRLFLFVIISFALYRFYVEFDYQNELYQVEEIHRNQLKAVQFITGRFRFKNWGLKGLGREPFKGCAKDRCYAFQPHISVHHKPYEKSDAIVVHSVDLIYLPWLRSYERNPRQLWVFYTIESQRYAYCSLYYSIHDMDGLFNLSVTFKPQSDIIVNYRNPQDWSKVHLVKEYVDRFKRMIDRDQNFLQNQFINFEHKRRSSVLWFVSHCDTASRRESYVKELQKYIKVDIYGWCSSDSGARSDPCESANDRETCMVSLYNSYKFYLAFENSHCDYYITEKYFKIYKKEKLFNVNILPVVRGARLDDYLEAAPDRRSFVFADEFNSPQHLADYLHYLDRNSSAYMEYFDWKPRLFDKFAETVRNRRKMKLENDLARFDQPLFCELCARLHNESYLSRPKSVKLTDVFNPYKDCRDPGEANVVWTFIKSIIGHCM